MVRRAFCSEVSLENAEPLAGTASRVDHWLLVEYRGLWSHDALAGSGLSTEVKTHLREQAAARPNTKLLLVRRTQRRGRPGLAVFWGSSAEQGAELYGTEVETHADLLELDVTRRGDPVGHPLVLVCTHGKHDRCCARYGRPLYQSLEEQAEDDWVWQSSHLGGDRFAGNVVVLPQGLYFGRVEPGEAWPVLRRVSGRPDRARQLPRPEQLLVRRAGRRACRARGEWPDAASTTSSSPGRRKGSSPSGPAVGSTRSR